MLDLLRTGRMVSASATAFSLSPEGMARSDAEAQTLGSGSCCGRRRPATTRRSSGRLGVLAVNGLIEADAYSTHVVGSRIQNGIGGSGDFARNACISSTTPSTARGGAISTIVPMVGHVDHTEHDVAVLVTEQGLADLRGLASRRRAELVIERCAHPDDRPLLRHYYERALRESPCRHTPHLLAGALSWHTRYLAEGSMLPER
jgi:succinyl-CoA:acetate CoA-transferase